MTAVRRGSSLWRIAVPWSRCDQSWPLLFDVVPGKMKAQVQWTPRLLCTTFVKLLVGRGWGSWWRIDATNSLQKLFMFFATPCKRKNRCVTSSGNSFRVTIEVGVSLNLCNADHSLIRKGIQNFHECHAPLFLSYAYFNIWFVFDLLVCISWCLWIAIRLVWLAQVLSVSPPYGFELCLRERVPHKYSLMHYTASLTISMVQDVSWVIGYPNLWITSHGDADRSV